MSRTILLYLVIVVLVASSGCNAFINPDITTLTPAPVPTDEPPPTPVPQLAPGLTQEGVVNASALAASHDALLENTSFTVRRTVTYRTHTGTPVRRMTSVARVGDDELFLVTKRWNGTTPLRRVAYYYDGERLLVATTDAFATTYRRVSLETVTSLRSVVAGTDAERIERLFVAAEMRVVGRTERNGTMVYRLVPAVGQNQSNVTVSLSRSVNVHARITTRGLVRRYTFRQTLSGEGPDGAVVIVVSTRYTDVGSTAPERPAWYAAAVSATNTTKLTDLTSQRSGVRGSRGITRRSAARNDLPSFTIARWDIY
jgi:hypothetical protein